MECSCNGMGIQFREMEDGGGEGEKEEGGGERERIKAI